MVQAPEEQEEQEESIWEKSIWATMVMSLQEAEMLSTSPKYVCVQWWDFQSSSWDRSEERVSHKEARLQLGKMLQETIKIIFPSLQKMNNNPLKFCSWKQVDLEGIAFCRYWSVQAVGSWLSGKPPVTYPMALFLDLYRSIFRETCPNWNRPEVK